MAARFAELDFQQTPRGDVSLRRRHDPVLDVEVYEVLLGEEYLMSSAFTTAEEELSRLALARLGDGPLDVVVGGLGLGYTAVAALADERVRAMWVVDAFEPVISWHQRRLLPVSGLLLDDARTRLVHADFFDGLRGIASWGPSPEVVLDAVLVDIDHSPRHLLHPEHALLYRRDGLRALAERLRAGGVFGLWSDDPPDGDFLDVLGEVFVDVEACPVVFANPYTGGTSSNTVYLATRRGR
jgi:spermidine synthase